jgi:hypothetical protein
MLTLEASLWCAICEAHGGGGSDLKRKQPFTLNSVGQETQDHPAIFRYMRRSEKLKG